LGQTIKIPLAPTVVEGNKGKSQQWSFPAFQHIFVHRMYVKAAKMKKATVILVKYATLCG
jgi:hypothetical protein